MRLSYFLGCVKVLLPKIVLFHLLLMVVGDGIMFTCIASILEITFWTGIIYYNYWDGGFDDS